MGYYYRKQYYFIIGITFSISPQSPSPTLHEIAQLPVGKCFVRMDLQLQVWSHYCVEIYLLEREDLQKVLVYKNFHGLLWNTGKECIFLLFQVCVDSSGNMGYQKTQGTSGHLET